MADDAKGPSPEAVELAERLISNGWAYCTPNGVTYSPVPTEALSALVDSALRALEQRTRLETLERVADYVLDQGDEVARRFGGREGARWREFFDALSAAIRALQPLEAPKAEEPKR